MFPTSNMEKSVMKHAAGEEKSELKGPPLTINIFLNLSICPYPPNNCFFDTALGLWGLFL